MGIGDGGGEQANGAEEDDDDHDDHETNTKSSSYPLSVTHRVSGMHLVCLYPLVQTYLLWDPDSAH